MSHRTRLILKLAKNEIKEWEVSPKKTDIPLSLPNDTYTKDEEEMNKTDTDNDIIYGSDEDLQQCPSNTICRTDFTKNEDNIVRVPDDAFTVDDGVIKKTDTDNDIILYGSDEDLQQCPSNTIKGTDFTKNEDNIVPVPDDAFTVDDGVIKKTDSENNIINIHGSDEDFSSSSDKEKLFSSDDSDLDPSYINEADKAESSSSDGVSEETLRINYMNSNLPVKKTRKKRANRENWRRSVAKKLKNSGGEYVSLYSKKTVPAKIVGPPCHNCKLECSRRVQEEQRLEIFKNYWALCDVDKQRAYIRSCMDPIEGSRYKPPDSKRGNNNAYFFLIGEKKFRVCKVFFKSTLAITDRTVQTVISKTTVGGIVTEDKRGRHRNHKKLEEGKKESARNFINAIPRIESHYCRKDSKVEYVEARKTIADLHRDYKQIQIEKNEPFCKYQMFYLIFNYEFNISFFTPKKDQCEECIAYQNSDEKERNDIQENYEKHIREKDLSRIEKEKDKAEGNKNLVIAVYDLQAALSCPQGEASGFYYTSKLSVYNFTICELNNSKLVNCYVWYEGEGQRGVNEIASCVFKFLHNKNNEAKENGETIDIIFYSDNCAGQQKNYFMMALYHYAVDFFEFINSITHKFLIRGHTQNEGDSVHSIIERKISRALKSGPIYIPEQYYLLIRSAKVSDPPYTVNELTHDDFFDIKVFFPNYSFNNTIKISEIRIIKFLKNSLTINVKKSFEDKEFTEVKVRGMKTQKTIKSKEKKKGKKSPKVRNMNKKEINELNVLPSAYKKKLSICIKKKTGILNLINKKVIPKNYQYFYENL